jgi:acyl-CoA thioesterase-1
MKKKGIKILIVIIFISIGYMIISSQNKDILSQPKNATIVAFGDSLVAGYGATVGNDFVSVLSRELGVSIENFGRNGDTSALAFDRMDTVTARDPGIVILVIGGNDILRRVPIKETEGNIREIVKAFQRNNTQVVLVGVRGGLVNDPYASMYESIKEDYELAYLPDVLSGLLGRKEYMSDPIHPNDKGYAHIAKRLEKILTQYKIDKNI